MKDGDIFITQLPVSQLPLPFSQSSEMTVLDTDTQETNTLTSPKMSGVCAIDENFKQSHVNELVRSDKKKNKKIKETHKENLEAETIIIESQNDNIITEDKEENRSVKNTKKKKKKKKHLADNDNEPSNNPISIESDSEVCFEKPLKKKKKKKKKQDTVSENFESNIREDLEIDLNTKE